MIGLLESQFIRGERGVVLPLLVPLETATGRQEQHKRTVTGLNGHF